MSCTGCGGCEVGQGTAPPDRKKIDALLTRIMDATNERVIRTYEEKLAELEATRARLEEQAAKRTVPATSFKEN